MNQLSEKEETLKDKSKWTYEQLMFLQECKQEAVFQKKIDSFMRKLPPIRGKSKPRNIYITANPREENRLWKDIAKNMESQSK